MTGTGNRRLLGFIPARSGSVRVPHKNMRPIGGISPIRRAAEAALATTTLDAVAVSTDSPDYLREAADAGIKTHYLRPRHLATDDAAIADCVADYLDWTRAHGGGSFSHIVLLQPTSPFRTAADIDDAVRCWLESGCRSLVSVRPAAKRASLLVWGTPAQGAQARPMPQPPSMENSFPYVLNGAIYIAPVEDVIASRRWWDDRSILYVCETPDPHDIDTEKDAAAADALLRFGALGEKNRAADSPKTTQPLSNPQDKRK